MEKGNNTAGVLATIAIVAVLVVGGFWLFSGSNDETEEETQAPETSQQEVQEQTQPNIVETAASNPDFSTLVTAIQAAGLEEALSGEGPFTVFAPTNAAFDALPEGTLEDLLDNPDQLANILQYHVVSGEVLAEQVVNLDSATTLNGQDVSIRTENGNVFVNDAQVTTTDIRTSNGVIHVIDSVLLPQ
jgi:uncharacterized surface protein with fasciclin (FAS1) repeats